MNKPPRTYSVKVPTKTYLRKYIHALHGHQLRLNYFSPLGTFLLTILEKEYFDINMNASDTEIRLSYMQDEVEFIAPLGTMKYKGHSIPPDKIIAINRFLEDLFVEDLHRYCRDNLKNRAWRPGISDAINAFAEMCGIEMEEDISLEALKKAEFRYRKKIEKKFQRFVPSQIRPMQMDYFQGFHGLAMG